MLDNGAVHYHGLPPYGVPSAVELMKRVIDYFGTQPPGRRRTRGRTAMTVTRRNITESAQSGDRYVQGVVRLNQEMSGLTTAELNNILSPACRPRRGSRRSAAATG